MHDTDQELILRAAFTLEKAESRTGLFPALVPAIVMLLKVLNAINAAMFVYEILMGFYKSKKDSQAKEAAAAKSCATIIKKAEGREFTAGETRALSGHLAKLPKDVQSKIYKKSKQAGQKAKAKAKPAS